MCCSSGASCRAFCRGTGRGESSGVCGQFGWSWSSAAIELGWVGELRRRVGHSETRRVVAQFGGSCFEICGVGEKGQGGGGRVHVQPTEGGKVGEVKVHCVGGAKSENKAR